MKLVYWLAGLAGGFSVMASEAEAQASTNRPPAVPVQIETLPAPPPAPPPAVSPVYGPLQPATPRGNRANWAAAYDYPPLMLRIGAEGRTQVNLTIGPDGRVSDCTVTASSGWRILDDLTCRNIRRRARFTPATDQDARPTIGSFQTSVRWTFPVEDEGNLPPEPLDTGRTFIVETNGTETECRTWGGDNEEDEVQATNVPIGAAVPCAHSYSWVPHTEANGQAVRLRVFHRTRFLVEDVR